MTIGWQPINTAPKDGTAIIAYGLCIANIEDAFGPMMAVVAYNPHAHGGSYPWSFEGGGPYPTSMNATHWMPLPDRPQTATVTQTNPDTEPAPIGAPVRDIRAGAIVQASLQPAEDRGWIDLRRGMFFPRPGLAQTKKRQPPIPLPRRLVAHLRRWKRAGLRSAVEWNGEPVKRISKAFRATMRFSAKA